MILTFWLYFCDFVKAQMCEQQIRKRPTAVRILAPPVFRAKCPTTRLPATASYTTTNRIGWFGDIRYVRCTVYCVWRKSRCGIVTVNSDIISVHKLIHCRKWITGAQLSQPKPHEILQIAGQSNVHTALFPAVGQKQITYNRVGK